jgi:hypothetical protein
MQSLKIKIKRDLKLISLQVCPCKNVFLNVIDDKCPIWYVMITKFVWKLTKVNYLSSPNLYRFFLCVLKRMECHVILLVGWYCFIHAAGITKTSRNRLSSAAEERCVGLSQRCCERMYFICSTQTSFSSSLAVRTSFCYILLRTKQ